MGTLMAWAGRLVVPHGLGCTERPGATKGTGTQGSRACRSQQEKPTCHSNTRRDVLRQYYFSVNSIPVFFLLCHYAFCPTCTAFERSGCVTQQTIVLFYDHTFQNINWINYSFYFSQMDILVNIKIHKPTSTSSYFVYSTYKFSFPRIFISETTLQITS